MPSRSPRRSFLAVWSLVLGVALSGCGVIGGSSPTKTPTSTITPLPTATATPTPRPTLTPTSTPEPTATPTPVPVTSSGELPQGKTIVVRVPREGAASATVSFRGATYRMLADAATFWIPIAASTTADTGASELVVSLLDDSGAAIDSRLTTLTVVTTDFPFEAIEVPPDGPNGLRSADEVNQEEDVRQAVYAAFTPEKLWSGPLILPAQGPVTTAFGTARSYNGGPPSLHHSGTDFAADEGAAVVAAAAGRVAYAGLLTVRGKSIMIDHGGGVFTAYHHLSRIDVAEGDLVAQGQLIGAVGMTGLATGPHLHWELVVGGINVDPVYWTFEGVAP